MAGKTHDSEKEEKQGSSINSGTQKNHEHISKQMQESLLAFIEERKQRGDTIPKNQDELIALFLAQTKEENRSLFVQYTDFLKSLTGKNSLETITLDDLAELPIAKEGKLSTLLVQWHEQHLEHDKQRIVGNIWQNHYTKVITSTGNKQLITTREDKVKKHLNESAQQKLITKGSYLMTLQQLFDNYLHTTPTTDQQTIAQRLKNENNTPKLGDYLSGFEKAGRAIGDRNIKSSLLKDQRTNGLKKTGVESLAHSMVSLTTRSLLELGLVTREAKESIMHDFENTFSHTGLMGSIFNEFSREDFWKEQKHTHTQKDQKSPLYEQSLILDYLERINQQLKTKGTHSSKEELLEQISSLQEFSPAGFAPYREKLSTTLSAYLRDEYIQDQLNHDLIKAQFEQLGIDKKNYPAYLAFRQQVYDLESNQADLTIEKDGEKQTFSLVFANKRLLTHPEHVHDPDQLNQLFSFERSIDLRKSHELFKDFIGPTPKIYMVDEETQQLRDFLDTDHEIDLYLGGTQLAERFIISQKQPLIIDDHETGKQYIGYPLIKDLPDTKEDTKDDTPPSAGSLILADGNGKPIDNSPELPLTTVVTPPHLTAKRVLDKEQAEKYTLNVLTRTFQSPTTTPVLIDLLQLAVVSQLDPEAQKESTRTALEQDELLNHSNISTAEPQLDSYLVTTEEEIQEQTQKNSEGQELSEKELTKELFTTYTLASTEDIPGEIIEDARQRGQTPDNIRAWIAQGHIVFHRDYFVRTFGFKDIVYQDDTLTFVEKDDAKYTLKDAFKQPRIRACAEAIISAKVHEITHRILHFHDIKQLDYTTETGATITLTQEDLCEIADGKTRPRQKDVKTNQRYIMIDDASTQSTHRIWLNDLEARITECIPGFSRGTIKKLDATHLEQYTQDYDQFVDLFAASAPTISTVTKGKNALTKRLDTYIKKIEEAYDPNNEDHVTNLETAEKLRDTLQQQQTPLTNTATPPTQADLDQMHKQHQDVAAFLQKQQSGTSQPPAQGQQASSRATAPQGQQTAPQPITPQNTSRQLDSQPETRSRQQSGTSQPASVPSYSTLSEQKQAFDEGFATFKGDKGAPLVVGTSLFLKDTISSVPGRGFNRVKYTIKGMSDEGITFEMSDATEKSVTAKQTVTLPRSQQTIDQLKRVAKNDVYKFSGQANNKAGFFKAMHQVNGKRRNEVTGTHKTIQKDGKSIQEEISHIGVLKDKGPGNESILYEIDRGVGGATVTAQVPDGDKTNQTRKAIWKKKMDYDTLAMFVHGKDLNPLTKTEIKKAGESIDQSVSPRLPGHGMSLFAIWKALKTIPEKYKKKFEEEQEFQKGLAEDRVSQFIPNTSFLYLNEIKDNMGGTDGLVWQKIQKFKSDRSGLDGGGDKSSIHDDSLSKKIKEGVFEKMGDSRKFRYKAAGALLFALEKGGPYFRALGDYANKDGGGQWIKAILGEEARQKFLQERNKRLDLLKSNSIDADQIEEFHSKTVKYELEFIQNATTDKIGRGSKFGRAVEDGKDALYGGAGSIDPANFMKKGDFSYMLGAFLGGGIKQNMPWILFSSLEAMKNSVETPDQYNQFYMAVLAIFATGMVHMLPTDYVNKLKGIGRSRGMPITLFASDTHASGKVMRILDHIAQKAGVTTFSEFSGVSLNTFDNMDIHNYADGREKIKSSFTNRWANHGWTIVDAFNYKNDFLIDIDKNDKNADVVTSYLGTGGVFGGYKGVQDTDSFRNVDGQSPFFQEGILNLSEGAFKSYLMQFNNQGHPRDEHVATLWSNFSGILDQFGNRISTSSNEKSKHVMTQLLYKKFTSFFGDRLNANSHDVPEWRGRTYKELLDAAIKGEPGISIEDVIRRSIFREKDRLDKTTQDMYIVREDISSNLVKDAILKFGQLVKQSYATLGDPAHKADIFSS